MMKHWPTKIFCGLLTLALLCCCTPPPQQQRPNILVIIADDMGYADIGVAGGEIPTPNINALAADGLTLSRFYTSALCSPTRAMLMSGVDHHRAGLGALREMIAANQRGQDGYEGYLRSDVLTLAERLGPAGYSTFIAGKWHLGTEIDQSPYRRGFDRSFVLTGGGGSHFSDMAGVETIRTEAEYREDDQDVYELPSGFFSSDFFTDRILSYIDQDRTSGRPFLAMLSFTAPHWPIQAPSHYRDKHRGAYDAGWDQLRSDRIRRMSDLGLIPEGALTPDGRAPRWETLSTEERARQSRLMEVYAGMVDNMDRNIGRVLAYLRRTGEYDNTLIVFLSDNGADGFMTSVPMFNEFVSRFDNRIENLGAPGSYSAYGNGWAEAGEAAFDGYKGSLAEGGVRTMAIVRGPQWSHGGRRYDGPVSVMDVVPTVLDAAGVSLRAHRRDGLIEPQGISFAPLLAGSVTYERTNEVALGMELLGQSALVRGDWKIRRVGGASGEGEWQLFNVARDPGEQQDLSSEHPDVRQAMIGAWELYARENNVIRPQGRPEVVE